MGEFARSAAIASAVLERWPAASVHFVLSRQAPYAARAPFPVTLLPSSATFHSAAVIDLMRNWRPDVVVFDNAGRSRQIEAAHRLGARIVFISSRRRQRRRAFRLRWMRLIDEHWIAYPKLIAGDLGLLERVKLKLLGRPRIRYLDVILARRRRDATQPVPAARAATGAGEVVVIPGGGTGHPGAEDAAREFLSAARSLAAAGFATTFVGPAEEGIASAANFTQVSALPQADLAELMERARLIVANGGSTMLQAIACGAACVAAPIAGDQPERIRRCVAAGVAVQAAPIAADIQAKAEALLNDEAARGALVRRAAGLGLANGLEVALAALEQLKPRR